MRLLMISIALVLAACAAPRPSPAPAPTPFCQACEEPVSVGTVRADGLEELSGLAASARHPGVLWAHNDSGDSARLFALSADGEARGVFAVAGATAVDWEDLARGPCAAGSCLFVGDIGDNRSVRNDLVVYRVPEPESLDVESLHAEALPFAYPDGAHNAETLLVGADGRPFVVTKRDDGLSALYGFPMPLQPGTPVVLEKLVELAPPEGSPRFTGGDVDPLGRAVLLRTYDRLWAYPLEGGSIAAALGRRPCAIAAADEPQGEAVAFLADGSAWVSSSEWKKQPLWRGSCPAGR